MMVLYPTPTRLRLLAAVRDGHVRERYDPYYGYDSWDGSALVGPERKVSARMDAMRRAGWVRLVAGEGDRAFELTDEGRRVLASRGIEP